MNETREMIDRRIAILESALEQLAPGSEEYDAIESSIAEMLKLRAQIDKDETSSAVTADEGRKDRIVRIGTTIFSVGLPLVVYSALWKKGLAFEENGVVTSSSVKNLFQRFRFF